METCEEIVRALHIPLWDPDKGRATTSAFRQPDISVSRTSILPYDEIVQIFKADLERTMGDGTFRRIEATASLRVDALLSACSDANNSGLSVRVEADPIQASTDVQANPAHALIRVRDITTTLPKKLSRGMANAILKVCEIRKLD